MDLISRFKRAFTASPKAMPQPEVNPAAQPLMELKTLAPRDRLSCSEAAIQAEAWGSPPSGEVIIAMIGTGVDAAHPDLRGRVIGGVSFTEEPWYVDNHGQGTHVAGTISAGSPPVDDWRVEATERLSSSGDFHPQVFADLREQTLDLPAESAGPLQEVMAQDWLLQKEEALPLTGRVAGFMQKGMEAEAAYSRAFEADSPQMSIEEDFILVGDFQVEVRD